MCVLVIVCNFLLLFFYMIKIVLMLKFVKWLLMFRRRIFKIKRGYFYLTCYICFVRGGIEDVLGEN